MYNTISLTSAEITKKIHKGGLKKGLKREVEFGEK